MNKKIVIVGAGPAGIGMGILFKQLGVNDFVILEKDEVGSTFFNWPKEMKLITPSFTGHGFGLLDLNAIAPDTSPAFTFHKEHLSGEEYGSYLQLLAEHYELPVYEDTYVSRVDCTEKGYTVTTDSGYVESEYVIWATGEYQTSNHLPFEGAGWGLHNSEVASWKDLKGENFTIIGGYESGIDAAYHLVQLGKNVTVISRRPSWKSKKADPSLSLSPFTHERLNIIMTTNRLSLVADVEVMKITKEKDEYTLYLSDGSVQTTNTRPILATGFLPGASQIKSFFEWKDGIPLLNEFDESTIQENLFLVGPNVKHQEVIFCFIYKFRQRFAVVAKEILDRSGLEYDEAVFEKYRRNQMFLDDLTCCEVKCEC